MVPGFLQTGSDTFVNHPLPTLFSQKVLGTYLLGLGWTFWCVQILQRYDHPSLSTVKMRYHEPGGVFIAFSGYANKTGYFLPAGTIIADPNSSGNLAEPSMGCFNDGNFLVYPPKYRYSGLFKYCVNDKLSCFWVLIDIFLLLFVFVQDWKTRPDSLFFFALSNINTG